MGPDDFISTAGSLFERWRQYLALRGDAEALVRLVAIECRRNLAVLSALRLDSAEQSDPDLLAVAAVLESEALESLFAVGPKENKARKILAQPAAPSKVADDADEDLPGELLLRIYVRLTAMQKLLRLPRVGAALREIRWRTRLSNVESDLRTAVAGLDRVLSEKK